MKLSIVFKGVEKHVAAEAEVKRCGEKLEKFLKSFEPDLVQLHCVFSMVPRTEEIALALNLTLPTGTFHATAERKRLRSSCKAAFAEMQTQMKKHLAHLRKEHEWKRKRSREVALV